MSCDEGEIYTSPSPDYGDEEVCVDGMHFTKFRPARARGTVHVTEDSVDFIITVIEQAVAQTEPNRLVINFDYKAYVRKLVDGNSRIIIGYGPPQGGKSCTGSVNWLVAVVLGRPFFVHLCEKVHNSTELGMKLKQDMEIFMNTPAMRAYSPGTHKVFNMATTLRRRDIMETQLQKRAVASGMTAIIFTHTPAQITALAVYASNKNLPGAFCWMDEADVFFTDKEQTKRERLWSTFQNLSSDPTRTVLHKTVHMSATPLDLIAREITATNRVQLFSLDKDKLVKSGYTFAEESFELLDGMTFSTGEITKKERYGWTSPKTRRMYADVRLQQSMGVKNLLLIDICNPMVNVSVMALLRCKSHNTGDVFTDVYFHCAGARLGL